MVEVFKIELMLIIGVTAVVLLAGFIYNGIVQADTIDEKLVIPERKHKIVNLAPKEYIIPKIKLEPKNQETEIYMSRR